MLQHVEHQDEAVAPPRSEVPVERDDVDAVPVGAVRGDQRGVGLYALDRAELGEPLEEQPIPTPPAEDGRPAARRAEAPQHVQDQPLAGPPPPVPPVQVAVSGRVLRLHEAPTPPPTGAGSGEGGGGVESPCPRRIAAALSPARTPVPGTRRWRRAKNGS